MKNNWIQIKIDCKFPFKYNNIWYDTCAKDAKGSLWCSLDTTYAGRNASCAQACPILASSLIQTTDNGAIHTACSPPSTLLTQSLYPNDTSIQKILSLHNVERATAASTLSATNITTLAWDDNLGRLAQRRAETCQMVHDCYNCRTPLNQRTIMVGQNAYSSSGISTLNWSKTFLFILFSLI